MTFISYAQNFEDVMLWRALSSVKHGFYIDIGAAWPDSESVTKAFYDRGWSGINVEPHPDLFSHLQRSRPRDTNLCVAVDRDHGAKQLKVYSNAGWSSLLDDVLPQEIQAEQAPHCFEVRCQTLATIWKNHVPPKQQVHFLKIDAEGNELAIIEGNDWSLNRPWIVVVEATQPLLQSPCHQTWEPLLMGQGYRLLYDDGLNRFYAAEKCDEFRNAFRYPPNVFDNYVVWPHQVALERAASAELCAATASREVEELKSSLSWRLTSPLRAAKGTLKSLGELTCRSSGATVAHFSNAVRKFGSLLRKRAVDLFERCPQLKTAAANFADKLGVHSALHRLYLGMKTSNVDMIQIEAAGMTPRAQKITEELQLKVRDFHSK